jgi:hypothetical protein
MAGSNRTNILSDAMAARARTMPPDRSKTPSHKRDFDDLQNAAIDQELADEPWYALKPEEIIVLVVAPSSRLQTSVLRDHYIDRSIHLKGANKTILVMNKSDVICSICLRRPLAD